MTTVVFAGGMKKNIEVSLNGINIAVNGQKVKADNIAYNGTTYVPLRAMAEMMGKEVAWDEKTNTASINDKKAPSSGEGVDKSKYTNPRFGYSIEFPKEWESIQESQNGDGAILYQEGYDDIRVYAGYMMDATFKDYINSHYSGWEAKPANIQGADKSIKLEYHGEDSYQSALVGEKDGTVYTFYFVSLYITDQEEYEKKEAMAKGAKLAEKTFKVLSRE